MAIYIIHPFVAVDNNEDMDSEKYIRVNLFPTLFALLLVPTDVIMMITPNVCVKISSYDFTVDKFASGLFMSQCEWNHSHFISMILS